MIFKVKNLDNIFNLFEEFENQSNSNDETSLLVDFSDHPLYWISGFNKVLSNKKFFLEYPSKNFKDLFPKETESKKYEEIGEILMFKKAWEFIQNINTENRFHNECLEKKNSEIFSKNIILTIKFFEKKEEYEKCALLQKIENKLKEFSLI